MGFFENILQYLGGFATLAAIIAGFLYKSKRKRSKFAEEASEGRKATYVVKIVNSEKKTAEVAASATLVEAKEYAAAEETLSATNAELEKKEHEVDVATAAGGEELTDAFNNFLDSEPAADGPKQPPGGAVQEGGDRTLPVQR